MNTLLDETAFDKFVSEHNLALVDFSAIWCGPCRMLTKILEGLSKSDPGLAIGKIDIDTNSALTAKYDIKAVPTLLLFKNGKLVDRKMGAHPEDTIRSWIQSHA